MSTKNKRGSLRRHVLLGPHS